MTNFKVFVVVGTVGLLLFVACNQAMYATGLLIENKKLQQNITDYKACMEQGHDEDCGWNLYTKEELEAMHSQEPDEIAELIETIELGE